MEASASSPPVVLRLALAAARDLGVEFDGAFAAGVHESVRTVPSGWERGLWQRALIGTRGAWQRAYSGVAPQREDVAVIKAAIFLGLDTDASAASAALGRVEQRAVARTLRRCGVQLDTIAFAVGLRDDKAAWMLIADGGKLAPEFAARKVRTTCPRGHPYEGGTQGDGRYNRCRVCSAESTRRKRREDRILQLAGLD